MRRPVTVRAWTGVLFAATAGPALATVHPLVFAKRSAAGADGTAVDRSLPSKGGPDMGVL